MTDPADHAETASNDAKTGRTIAKRTLAERIAERRQIGQLLALTVIQDFLDDIAEELALGNRLEFRDFGVFETVSRRPRMALNPKTLEKVPVKARKVVKFKPGRLLKERVQHLPPDGGAVPPATA
jgi:integration host factor subunit beta